LAFNHTSENVLASTAFDNTVKVWDIEKQTANYSVSGPTEQYYSVEWNMDGSLLIAANKDKTNRIIDPRA